MITTGIGGDFPVFDGNDTVFFRADVLSGDDTHLNLAVRNNGETQLVTVKKDDKVHVEVDGVTYAIS